MKKIIIANWKLNPITLDEAKDLADKIDRTSNSTVVICPPTLFLASINFPFKGSQDCFWQVKGPYTGQVSAASLKDLGVKYCLVGHSELRNLGQTDEEINSKIIALIASDIIPVLCIGYGTTFEQDELAVTDILEKQLTAGLVEVDPKKIIVAYEPVWAISSGDPYATKKIATPDHAEKMAIYIKNKFGIPIVLYGGSVNSTNSESFLSQHNIDGLLVGGASLLAEDFNKIIN